MMWACIGVPKWRQFGGIKAFFWSNPGFINLDSINILILIKYSFPVRGWPLQCRVFSGIPSLCPLDARSILQITKIKNVSTHCRMSPDRKGEPPQLRSTGLIQYYHLRRFRSAFRKPQIYSLKIAQFIV